MDQKQILEVIKKNLMQAVDGIAEDAIIDPAKKFTDYGANSLDIVEVVSASMRELKIKIPRTELASIQNIGGLVDKFETYAQS